MNKDSVERATYHLSEKKIAALRMLLDKELWSIYMPELIWRNDRKIFEFHLATFRISDSPPIFVNFHTDWKQTKYSDFHTLEVYQDEAPARIKYDNEKRGIGPCSWINFGEPNFISAIEVMELTDRLSDEHTSEMYEQITYDYAFNFVGSVANFSLSTDHQSIMGTFEYRDTFIEESTEGYVSVRRRLTIA